MSKSVKFHHRVVAAFATLFSLLVSTQALSQDVTLRREYGEVIKSAEAVGALGDDLFGEQTNLYTGSTEFNVTDVSLSGTGLVPVSLGRRYLVEDKTGTYIPGSAPIHAFGDWEFDIPHLYGVFSRKPTYNTGATGWNVRNLSNKYQRCTVANADAARPDDVLDVQTNTTMFAPSEYWHGNSLHLPGGGDQEMLVITASNTQHPTDGKSYYWTTSGQWYFSCLSSTATGNGKPGEGFLAIDPNGTRYWFDWIVEENVARISKPRYSPPLEPSASSLANTSTTEKQPESSQKDTEVFASAYLTRKKVFIYPSKIEDRFGNTVTYHWDSTNKSQLNSITADDGRSISLTYVSGKVSTVTAGTRTWGYFYTNDKLTTVELPDTSTWEYALSSLEQLYAAENPTEPADCQGINMLASQTSRVGTITHPSGAVGEFTFKPTKHGRAFNNISDTGCTPISFWDGSTFQTFVFAPHPYLFSSFSLIEKQIDGPGLPVGGYTWEYDYEAPNESFVSCTGSCTGTKTVTVTTKDDGTAVDWVRYTFGNRFRQGEGQLLKTETGSDAAHILRTVNQTYQLDPTGQPYPSRIGESPFRRSDRTAEKHTPLKQRDIVQQARTFTWEATSWNLYAAPVDVEKYSTLGYSKTEKTTYRHDTTLWVLNQVSKLQNITAGTIDSEIGYDATCAMPTTTKQFGKLVETKSWNCSTGNLDWVQDGAGSSHRTDFSSYERGIPKRIDLADDEYMAATLDSNGQISTVTDQLGYTTSYLYDDMGRLKKVTYPGSDTVAWQTRNLTFTPVDSAEYNIPAGHWRRTEIVGNHRIYTYYDALWRPLVTREWDSTSGTTENATRRVTLNRYDHAGRTTHSSYPVSSTSSYLDNLDGIETTYDALGRVTGTIQDSELVTDPITTTAYISGFKTVFTNARSEPTTTAYYAWDTPTTDFPKDSTEPGGVTTTVFRDSWGKPTQMLRSGSYTPPGGSPESFNVSRYYVYDSYQRLCKTREPDAGITISSYDSAGNVAWQAKGQNSLTNPSNCQSGNVLANQKSMYYYDDLNRLLAIDHPSGTDDVGYTYFDDGAMQTATVGVLNGTNPVSWSTKKNEWTYTYNKRRLQETATLAIDGKSFQLNPTYDALGNLSNLTYPSGHTISYAPNALGQATKASNGATNYANNVTYHRNGIVQSFTFGNSTTHSVTLNARQLPNHILDQYGATKRLEHTLTYDANANVKSITDGVGGVETRTLNYDGRDRLTGITGSPNGNETFEYDALDRIRRVTGTGKDLRYSYNTSTYLLDRIYPAGSPTLGVSYGWNARGELSDKTFWFEGAPPLGPNEIFGHGFEAALTGSTVPYVFDNASRLSSVLGATVQYDAHGHRVKNVEPPGYTRYHVYDQGGTLRYTEDVIRNERKEYIQMGGKLIAERSRPLNSETVSISYAHSDERSSVTVMTASNGALQYRRPFEAFGEPDGPWIGGPGFAGHEMEEVGNLVYMRQRYYDPAGFFLSPDPVPSSRSDFNPYAYARNNPYSYIDPDGRQNSCPDMQCNQDRQRQRQQQRDQVYGGNGIIINYKTGRYYDQNADAKAFARTAFGPIAAIGVALSDDEYGRAAFEAAAAAIPFLKLGKAAAVFMVFARVERAAVASSRALGAALEAAGFIRPTGSAAHHIVAGGAEAAAPARAVLERFGIGINDAANGVFLPATKLSPNATGAAVHSTLHTRAYYQTVNEAMQQATTRAEAIEVLGALRQSLRGGGM